MDLLREERVDQEETVKLKEQVERADSECRAHLVLQWKPSYVVRVADRRTGKVVELTSIEDWRKDQRSQILDFPRRSAAAR